VTPEQFTNNFGAIAEAPEGIAELRHLVLLLAMRGELGTQDQRDEPIAATIASAEVPTPVSGRKNQAGKEATEQVIPGDAALSVGHPERDAPRGWRWVPLHEVACLESGHTPSRRHHDYWDGDIPWIGIKDARAHHGGVVFKTLQSVTQKGLDNSAARLLPTGTVCLSRTASVGYVLVMGRAMATSQDFVNWVCSEAVHPPFLAKLFLAENRGLRRFSKGTVHRTIYYPEVKAFHVCLPPLAEQKRIVAKVDQLMAMLDELEQRQDKKRTAAIHVSKSSLDSLVNAEDSDQLARAWERVSENFGVVAGSAKGIKKLRQSVLALAIRGRLSERRAADGSVDHLLRAIENKRATLKVRRGKGNNDERKRAEPVRSFPLPPGWKWRSFSDVTICRDGERVPVSRADRENRQGDYDYYGASGVIDTIDDFLFDQPLLLIGEDGANLLLRSKPIAFIARGKYWVNNHAHVLDSVNEHALRYLEVFINAIDLTPYVTGTAQPKMNQAKMNSIPIALPPLAEQRRIVAKVDHLMGMIDELETRLDRKRSAATKLATAAATV